MRFRARPRCPREVAESVDGIGVSVYEGYGLTETSPVISTNIPGQRKLGSVGKPLPGVQVMIDRSVIGHFRYGEIVVSGPNVMSGYHNRREETNAVLNGEGSCGRVTLATSTTTAISSLPVASRSSTS